jgi:hypothetical protein
LPQTGHGLTGRSYTTDGKGRAVDAVPIPSAFDRVSLLVEWVEHGVAPGRAIVATGPSGTKPICSYPEYPRYAGGPPNSAASYLCQQ